MPRNSARKSSVTPTTTPRINSAIEKKLLGYAALATAAGVGALALAQPSEAEVIYTPTNQKIAGASLYLDLNGDGINDFFFQPRSSAGGHVKTFSTRSGAAMILYPVAKTNQVWGSVGGLVSALPPKVVLSKKGKFGNNLVMGGVSAQNGGSPSYDGPWAPAGGSIKNGYIGLKFVIAGQIHYGWARLSVRMRVPREGGLHAVLTGYAYETVANKPILTGQTKGAEVAQEQKQMQKNVQPQPATLGRLAQGATGLVAWRRELEEIRSGQF